MKLIKTILASAFLAASLFGPSALQGCAVAKTNIEVDVRNFGATPNDATDDTTAIQAAIDYADSIKGGTGILYGVTVKLPAGQYRTKGGLLMKKGITLEGASENGSVLSWDGTQADAESIGYCLGIIGNRGTSTQLLNAYVKNLSFGIYGTTSLAALKPFILCDYAVEPTFKNVRTAGLNTTSYVLTTGIEMRDTLNPSVAGFVNDGGWTGLTLVSSTSSIGVGVGRFDDMHIYGTRASAISAASSNGNVFTNTLIETYACVAAGASGAYLSNCDRNTFNGLLITTGTNKLAYGVQLDGDCTGNTITGLSVNGPSSVGLVIGSTSENNAVSGGNITSSGGDGVTIQANASYNRLSNIASVSNTGDGFDISASTAANNSLVACVARSNGGVGFKAAAGSSASATAATAASNTGGDVSANWSVMQRAGSVSGVVTFADPPVMSGASITAASVPDSALSSNVPLKNAANSFSAAQTFNGNISQPFLNATFAQGLGSGGTYGGKISTQSTDRYQYWPIAYSGATLKAQMLWDSATGAALLDVPGGLTVRDTVNGGGSNAATLSATGNLALLGTLSTTQATIGSGTAVTKVSLYTPSLTPTAVTADTSAEQTFTVTGLATTDTVVVNPPASFGDGLVLAGARVSAANTLAVRFGNMTAGSLTPVAGTYRVLAVRN